jgi:CO/xanthine dehydrogenase FAD-binding subunit
MNSFALANCTTVDAALSQLKDGAVVKAGGVDLLGRMKNGTIQPTKLVNIRNISSLRGIHETEKGLTIGALTTLAEISDHPLIREKYQILSDACGHAATPHLRNMATVGQSAAAGSVLVLPFGGLPVHPEGQGILFCIHRAQPVSRHHGLRDVSRGCAIIGCGCVAGAERLGRSGIREER